MDTHLDRITGHLLDLTWLLRVHRHPSLMGGWTREENSARITERMLWLYMETDEILRDPTTTNTQHNVLVELWRCIEEEEAAQLDASL